MRTAINPFSNILCIPSVFYDAAISNGKKAAQAQDNKQPALANHKKSIKNITLYLYLQGIIY